MLCLECAVDTQTPPRHRRGCVGILATVFHNSLVGRHLISEKVWLWLINISHYFSSLVPSVQVLYHVLLIVKIGETCGCCYWALAITAFNHKNTDWHLIYCVLITKVHPAFLHTFMLHFWPHITCVHGPFPHDSTVFSGAFVKSLKGPYIRNVRPI